MENKEQFDVFLGGTQSLPYDVSIMKLAAARAGEIAAMTHAIGNYFLLIISLILIVLFYVCKHSLFFFFFYRKSTTIKIGFSKASHTYASTSHVT